MDNKKIKIGFTVAVFDCLHQGHINFLKNCYKYCDYLIVALMTDYWVMVQKGKDRPEQSLEIRINALKEMNLCDKIIEMDTLDMTEYLKMVDVFIKGEGQNNMRYNYSGEIVYIPRTPNISTTNIIQQKRKK